jgi:hypothetical protein
MSAFSPKQGQAPELTPSSTPGPIATAQPVSSQQQHILNLQRTIGNQAVLRLLQAGANPGDAGSENGRRAAFGLDFASIPNLHTPVRGIQRKLTVNMPGDAYEQEADRVAEQVMRMPAPQTATTHTASVASGGSAAGIQRACACGGSCDDCKKKHPEDEHARVQMKAAGPANAGGMEAPPIVHEVLRSPGQPLDKATRAFMEPRFRSDFSGVRVHTDAKAVESAKAVNARAYTVGRNVVFGTGEFSPGTHEGQRLLGHELTHVVQQERRIDHMIQREPLSPDEQYVRVAWGEEFLQTYRLSKERNTEIIHAHQIYKATGRIPQTKNAFSFIEIKEGRLMSRAERYDAMLQKQGKDNPIVRDLIEDNRNSEYLTAQEFHDEFYKRHQAEWDECDEAHLFRGPTYKCQKKVDEKYGGQEFKLYQEQQDARLRQDYAAYSAHADDVVNSGLVGTLGRGGGYAAAKIFHKDPLTWSEYGAMAGNVVDIGLAGYTTIAAKNQIRVGMNTLGDGPVGPSAPLEPMGIRAPAPERTPLPKPEGAGAVHAENSVRTVQTSQRASEAAAAAAGIENNAPRFHATSQGDVAIDPGVGLAREMRVAEELGGRVAKKFGSKGDKIHGGRDIKIPVNPNSPGNSVKIDVFGPNGELVVVGGPAKADPAQRGYWGDRFKALADAARFRGVEALAYFEEGTPKEILDLAQRWLGQDHVRRFK